MTVASLPTALEDALARVDAIADRAFAGWKVPGLAYGVVRDGRLVHARGLGTTRVGEDATPHARSVFRIASMTKSFTAATVLSLRDEGRLALDDRADRYVPELAGLRYPTADSPPITVRHLLTMTAGFPTDDPWGDRQQGLDLDEFRRLLATGLSFAFAPGTRFEYSNTGYGILGRLITNVAGAEYRDVVRARLLEPLGMADTTYDEAEVDPARRVQGYLWRDERYLEEPSDPYGALASMGGLFTTVEDLVRWVGFFTDAFPPRDDPDSTALGRASRREMQQPMVDAGTRLSHRTADAAADVERMAYGFGLFVVDDVRFGRITGHSGGYPGFGSNMRWHAASGLGVIALTNHRYGPAALLARDLLHELLRSEAAPARRIRPNAATEAARDAVEGLLAAWDDDAAARLFAMNVELDEPLDVRRVFAEKVRERHGTLSRDNGTPDESASPFHLAWWLDGSKGGRVKAEVLLSPELPPRIQAFSVTSIPEPPVELAHAAQRIVVALSGGAEGGPVAIDWPSDLAVAEGVDLGTVVRSMRAAEAGYAPLTLGRAVDGDGERKATFRLESARGALELALGLDPAAGCLDAVSLAPARLESPLLD